MRRSAFVTAASMSDGSSINDESSTLLSSTSSLSPLDRVERIFCISDLHTDNRENLQWLRDKCSGGSGGDAAAAAATAAARPGPNDVVLVAGDISHEFSIFRETLQVLQEGLQSQIFFVAGNHEAWVGSGSRARENKESLSVSSNNENNYDDYNDNVVSCSFGKLQEINDICNEMGIHTSGQLVGGATERPVWIAPMQGWYDGTLTLEGCDDLCGGFSLWPWTDFSRCHWTDAFPLSEELHYERIPMGLTEHFLQQNEVTLEQLQQEIQTNPKLGGIITMSHFLPNKQSLPDWKDLDSDSFLRSEWLTHGAPGTSAKFAKVAGSALIDEQIRSIQRFDDNNGQQQQEKHHVHVFGHSHRTKDFTYKGIRYVHNPLGKPRERQMYMVSPDVDFQLLWDTTRDGAVPAERQILRLWEEQGGGVEALQQRMKKRKGRK